MDEGPHRPPQPRDAVGGLQADGHPPDRSHRGTPAVGQPADVARPAAGGHHHRRRPHAGPPSVQVDAAHPAVRPPRPGRPGRPPGSTPAARQAATRAATTARLSTWWSSGRSTPPLTPGRAGARPPGRPGRRAGRRPAPWPGGRRAPGRWRPGRTGRRPPAGSRRPGSGRPAPTAASRSPAKPGQARSGGQVEGGQGLLAEVGLGHRGQHAGRRPGGAPAGLGIDQGHGQARTRGPPGHGQADDAAADHHDVVAAVRGHRAPHAGAGARSWAHATTRPAGRSATRSGDPDPVDPTLVEAPVR